MSLFRDLNQAAIEANVGKNAYKVFLALLEQTLGYGKSTDRLTDNRLAYLSKVRIDRFRPAVQAVLACGVFEQTPAKKFQFRYTIGQSFLEKYPDLEFYTPALPKKRADFRKTEAISEKERHTALDLDTSLSSFLQPLQTLIQSSADMMQQQMQQQNEWINILLQAQTNQQNTANQTQNPARATSTQADRMQPETAETLDTAAFSDTGSTNISANLNTNLNTNPLSTSSVVNIPLHPHTALYRNEDQLGNTRLATASYATVIAAIHSSSLDQTLRKTEPNADQNQKREQNRNENGNENGIDNPLTEYLNTPQPLQNSDEDYLNTMQIAAAEYDNTEPSRQAIERDKPHNPSRDALEVLPLPQAIAECIAVEDYPECNSHLATLSEQKQRDVFVVYEDIIRRDGVHYPVPLFKSLVEKAKKTGSQGLSVPQGIAKAKARKVSEANKITHPSMIIQTPEVRAERERQELASQDESLRSMLRINSQLQRISVEELAEKLLLTHLLPV